MNSATPTARSLLTTAISADAPLHRFRVVVALVEVERYDLSVAVSAAAPSTCERRVRVRAVLCQILPARGAGLCVRLQSEHPGNDRCAMSASAQIRSICSEIMARGTLQETVMRATNNLVAANGRLGSPALDRLKRVIADHAEPGWSVTLPAHDDRSTDRPLVLVVDDDPVNRTLAGEQLSCWGMKPLLAAGGAEAVILACELRLDLILMDLQMPEADGFAATAQIRRFEREHGRRRVPVVAYTSASVSADEPRLRDSGIDAVLHKPADAQAIRECVTRWCLQGPQPQRQRAAMSAHALPASVRG
jgi:CheY-like chemotaxis protein